MLQRIVNRAQGFKGSYRSASSVSGGAPEKPKKKGQRVIASALPMFSPCGEAVGALLSAHDRKQERVRLGSEWIHVSALINGECLRAVGIAHLEDVTAYEKPRPADRLLWAIGKAVEKHIRDSMIELYGAHNCMGRWQCPCEALDFEGEGDLSRKCGKCGKPASTYSEFNVKHRGTMLSGSPDLLVRREGSRKWTPLEIKSIKVVPKGGVVTGAPDFHNLEAAQRGHVLQVLMYRRLMLETGHEMTDEALVCYGAKDYVMQSPYKFFTIDGEAEENVKAVNHLMKSAKEYALALKSRKVTGRSNLCPNHETNKAKGCHCKVSCFSRKS